MEQSGHPGELRWRCRRGMKELDQLLCRYLDQAYSDADDAQKSAFRELLSLSDPELVAYLLKREKPASEHVARIVDRILSLPRT